MGRIGAGHPLAAAVDHALLHTRAALTTRRREGPAILQLHGQPRRQQTALDHSGLHRQGLHQPVFHVAGLQAQQRQRKAQLSRLNHGLRAKPLTAAHLHLLCAAQRPALGHQQPTQSRGRGPKHGEPPELDHSVAAAFLAQTTSPLHPRGQGSRLDVAGRAAHRSQRAVVMSWSIQPRARSASEKGTSI